jgi:hypothetical protein
MSIDFSAEWRFPTFRHSTARLRSLNAKRNSGVPSRNSGTRESGRPNDMQGDGVTGPNVETARK